MPAPENLLPILDVLGDGATVDMAERVAALVNTRTADATAEITRLRAELDITRAQLATHTDGAEALSDEARARWDAIREAASTNDTPPPPAYQAAPEPTNAEVRAWCLDNHVPVSVKGAVGKAAREAYDKAHAATQDAPDPE